MTRTRTLVLSDIPLANVLRSQGQFVEGTCCLHDFGGDVNSELISFVMTEDKDLLLKERGGMSRYSPLSDEEQPPKPNQDTNDKRCGFNRRAFIMFFGVTAVAVAVLISAVVLTVYSGTVVGRILLSKRLV